MNEEESKPTVFIVNEGYHDYSPAEEFGDLVFMSSDPSGIPQYKTSSMARLFQSYIEASSPNDYILVTSLTVMIAVATSMFARKHGKINLLIYKANEKRYLARTIILKKERRNEETKN